MKHPYYILCENISKYSKTLKENDVQQHAENAFIIPDKDFDKLTFFNDVTKETGIKVLKHEYIGASCADPNKCISIFDVYGFDNVLFYFPNKKY